jgi:RNA polymerase sigma-70 factor (ECF subfamily)
MIDDDVAALVRAGNAREAARRVIEAFGAEVFGYVVSVVRDEDLAGDAFGAACESVLTGIPAFRRESSVRTWFYTIARHAAYRELKRQSRTRRESISSLDAALEAQVRTATAAFRKTDVKDGIARLRESLSAEERELLLLRVDRGLAWNEIAAVYVGTDGADGDALKQAAARCRKQFERAKTKLRELAEREGLLPPRD